jgi:hypothetical protein
VWTGSSIRMAFARGRHGVLGACWRILGRIGVFVASVVLRTRDRGVSLYVRGSTAQGDLLPGMSDVDLVALAPDGEVERTRRRWKTACRFVPLDRLVSVGVWRTPDLEASARATALTYRASNEHAPTSAMAPALVRPDLYGAGIGWQLASGRDVRPQDVTWDEGERAIIAWGELQHWWRFVFKTALRERVMDRLNYPWLKVIVEHARVLLWLDHSIVARSRREVLERAVRIWPDDDVVRRAQRNWDTGASPVSIDVPEVLTWALSKVEQVADRLTEDSPDGGARTVKLAGAHDVLPLADWHARALARPFDERLVPTPGDPTDLDFLAQCVRDADEVRQPAIEYDGLLLLPSAVYGRAVYRAIQCPVSDPVSFALLRGEHTAAFPGSRGWSAPDGARRAVEEHALWLSSSASPSLRTLGRMLNAVRAASFASSLESSSPTLPLSRMAVAENPPEGISTAEDAFAGYAVSLRDGTAVPHALVDELRDELLRLPAFAEVPTGWVHAENRPPRTRDNPRGRPRGSS